MGNRCFSSSTSINAHVPGQETPKDRTKDLSGNPIPPISQDTVVNSFIANVVRRANEGNLQYENLVSVDDDSMKTWIQNIQSEMIDAVLFLEKIKLILERRDISETLLYSEPPKEALKESIPEVSNETIPTYTDPLLIDLEDAQPKSEPKIITKKTNFEEFI
jgi:hypothetical protein